MLSILVGILKTSEPQIHELIDFLDRQLLPEDDVFIIENLPKNEAHDKLYATFQNRANDFDLFLKIDADMTIEDIRFLPFLRSKFSQNPILDWLHIHIWDCLLEKNISGLNIYSNRVQWNKNIDNVFTDRTMVSQSIVKSEIITEPEEKFIYHCKNPSLEQAVNFGMHRSIKAFQFGTKNPKRNTVHGLVFFEMIKSYFLRPSSKKLIVLTAYLKTVEYRLSAEAINRDSNKRMELIEELRGMSNTRMIFYIMTRYESYFLSLWKVGYIILFRIKRSL